MWQVAEELGAMLVFAEHRYYGDSMPFGPDSYSVSGHMFKLCIYQRVCMLLISTEMMPQGDYFRGWKIPTYGITLTATLS